MDHNDLVYHVRRIRKRKRGAINDFVTLASQCINPRLDAAFNRGFTNETWEHLLQPFIDQALNDPLFEPQGSNTKQFFYRLAYPKMRSIVRYFNQHGEYPSDVVVVNYQAYRDRGILVAEWFYYVF